MREKIFGPARRRLCALAMAVAAALDKMQWPEIAGCIAGDDTIMCAVRSVDETIAVMGKLRRILAENGEQ